MEKLDKKRAFQKNLTPMKLRRNEESASTADYLTPMRATQRQSSSPIEFRHDLRKTVTPKASSKDIKNDIRNTLGEKPYNHLFEKMQASPSYGRHSAPFPSDFHDIHDPIAQQFLMKFKNKWL